MNTASSYNQVPHLICLSRLGVVLLLTCTLVLASYNRGTCSTPDTIIATQLEPIHACWGLCVYHADTLAYETLGGSTNIPAHAPWNNSLTERSFLVRSTDDAYSGHYSIGLNYLPSSYKASTAALQFKCPLQQGQKYQVSFMAKGSISDIQKIQVFWADTLYQTQATSTLRIENTSGNWYSISTEITAPTELGYIMWAYDPATKKKRPESTGRVFIDDILITSPQKHYCPPTAMPTDTTLVLKDMYFAINSDSLTAGTEKTLDGWIAWLQKAGYHQLNIVGHTDNTGTQAYNQSLSEGRASQVAQYLINKGIDAHKITVEGKGSSQPLVANNSEDHKALNRRVEIKVVFFSYSPTSPGQVGTLR